MNDIDERRKRIAQKFVSSLRKDGALGGEIAGLAMGIVAFAWKQDHGIVSSVHTLVDLIWQIPKESLDLVFEAEGSQRGDAPTLQQIRKLLADAAVNDQENLPASVWRAIGYLDKRIEAESES
jgi:hypothetical protein